MNCNCKYMETIFGLAILIVTIWPDLIGASASRVVVIIAAALLVLHAWSCKNCGMCMPEGKSMRKKRR